MRLTTLLCLLGLLVACAVTKRTDRPVDSTASSKNGSDANQSNRNGDSDNGTALVVANAIPLDDDCVAKAGGEIVRSRGRYDVFCGSSYRVAFEIWNSLIPRGNLEEQRYETDIVQFERAEVQLMTSDNTVIIPTFSALIGGSVAPGDETGPGKSVVEIELIPAAAISRLPSVDDNPQIVAELQLFGKTTADVEVETSRFRFPIDLCDGCLTYLVDLCLWTADDMKSLTEARGCQHGGGYDDGYCWCNSRPTSSTSLCEFCAIPVR